jgi:hypothetical protein
MNLRSILVFSAVMGLLAASTADAQKLSLRIEQGLVTLDAQNVTVDEVLARWAAATGLNVVSKHGIGSDIPVTIQLSGVSEREALRMVLRDLSGYIMGERRDPQTGVVRIDRLLILSESAPQVAAPTGRPRSPIRRGVPPPPVVETPAVAVEATELAPQPEIGAAPGAGRAGRLIGSGPGAMLDFTGGVPNEDPALEAETRANTPPASTNPFGNSVGAARPGEMTPAPPAEVAPIVIRSQSQDMMDARRRAQEAAAAAAAAAEGN